MAIALSDYKRQLQAVIGGNPGEDFADASNAAATAVIEEIHLADERPQLFGVLVCHEGVTALRFDLWRALEVAVRAVGGVASGNAVAAGTAVVACLLALRGIVQRAPEDVARVLVALQGLGDGATVGEIQELLGPGATVEDVTGWVRRLEELDAVVVESGRVRLVETVIVRYRALPRLTPRL